MIVRADLTHGEQAAQIIHAAGYSSPGHLPKHTTAVALHARNEEELQRLAYKLAAAGVDFEPVIESEGVHDGHLMAIGVRPGPKEVLRRHLSSLPLVR